MRDAGLFQNFGNGFGFFDGDGAYEHRLSALVKMADTVGQRIVFLEDAVDHGFKLFFFGAIDDVGIFPANQRAIRWNHDNVKVVNLAEFGSFGFRGTGHAGKLFVHAEVILEGDRRERLVFPLDLHAFFSFNGLVETVGPAPTGHLPSGEFVDDDDFAIFVDVVDIDFVQRMGAQGLIDMVHRVDVGRIGHIGQAEEALTLIEAFFGQRGLAMLFVDGVVDVTDQLGNDFVDLEIFVGGLFGWAGDNQRGARLVDQDGVDFIDDGEVMATLNAVREVVLHV